MVGLSLAGAVLSIVLIDLSLSGDNAAVIGLAIRELPPTQARLAAIVGALGAIAVRIIFTGLATLLTKIRFVNAAGGLILVWVTYKLVVGGDGEEHGTGSGRFWGAIWAIILADLSTGFDNMMAVAGAAHGDVILVVFGLIVSMPLLIWGSSLIARLMNEHPVVVYVGAAVLARTSLAMIVSDEGLHVSARLGEAGVVGPWIFALLVLAYGWFRTSGRGTAGRHGGPTGTGASAGSPGEGGGR